MHLKNFSLIVDEQGITRLTPAYDLLRTRLVIPNDPLALAIMGKKDNLDRTDWLGFAERCRLPEKTAQGVLDKQASLLGEARDLIERSFLSSEMKTQYQGLIDERTARLA